MHHPIRSRHLNKYHYLNYIVISLLVLAFLSGCASWNLVWSDEFTGPQGALPDPSKWTPVTGGQGWGNQELQYYTDTPDNASLDGNGNLVITARALPDPAASGLTCWYGPCQFTSARIFTGDQFNFTYGRAEARIRIPVGKGVLPAFWLLGTNCQEVGYPACGEIDIMEINGGQPSTLFATVHGPSGTGSYSVRNRFTLLFGDTFSTEYHIYSAEWEPGVIRWYVDNHLYGVVRKSRLPQGHQWVFDHPFSIILDVAVRGDPPNNPDQSTIFPLPMYVDYVRIYQRN